MSGRDGPLLSSSESVASPVSVGSSSHYSSPMRRYLRNVIAGFAVSGALVAGGAGVYEIASIPEVPESLDTLQFARKSLSVLESEKVNFGENVATSLPYSPSEEFSEKWKTYTGHNAERIGELEVMIDELRTDINQRENSPEIRTYKEAVESKGRVFSYLLGGAIVLFTFACVVAGGYVILNKRED
ncbi:MAG: hypothetical protein Q8P57_00440 [Candidatus Pacearchaeota archaeon]|nr:hypothetical protein [Candidatus Pacearchaeota archaeon]